MDMMKIYQTTYCMYRGLRLQFIRLSSNSTSCHSYIRETDTASDKHTLNLQNISVGSYFNHQNRRRILKGHNSCACCGKYIQRRHCSSFVNGKNQDGPCSSPPWKILFFGTDHFSLFTLKCLNENRLQDKDSVVESLEVVTGKEKKSVRRYAEQAGLEVHNWPLVVPDGKYDVGVLVSFGNLIPEKVINSFPYGILNVHPSLLPRWRGASPLVHTILNGDKETGISIMEIRPKHFDTGPVKMQEKLPVPPDCTTRQLHNMLGPIGGKMLIKCLYNLPTLDGLEVTQSGQEVSYANKTKPEMTYIDWENQTRESINRQYRALHEDFPLKSHYGKVLVKLKSMVPVTDEIDESILYHYGNTHLNLPPGTPCYGRNSKVCWIKCKDGWVGFRELIIKKKLTASDFYSGYLINDMYKNHVFASHRNHLFEHVPDKKVTAAN